MGHFVDRCWYLDRYEVWNHRIRDLDTRNSGLDPCFHMFICRRICMVMGSIRMVSTKWDLSVGNQTCGTSHQRLCQHVLHFHHWTVLPHIALPHEVWSLLLLWRNGCDHDRLHLLLVAWDKRGSYWRDGKSVEAASFLETLHPRWCCYWRKWRDLCQGGLRAKKVTVSKFRHWFCFPPAFGCFFKRISQQDVKICDRVEKKNGKCLEKILLMLNSFTWLIPIKSKQKLLFRIQLLCFNSFNCQMKLGEKMPKTSSQSTIISHDSGEQSMKT